MHGGIFLPLGDMKSLRGCAALLAALLLAAAAAKSYVKKVFVDDLTLVIKLDSI